MLAHAAETFQLRGGVHEDEEDFSPNLAQLLWDTTSESSPATVSKPSKCGLSVHAARSTTLSPILSDHHLVECRQLLLYVNLSVELWSVICESEGCAEG